MNVEDLKRKVRSYLDQDLQGLEMESNKIEFKRDWPDLKDKYKVSEFVKDISAIANTYGLDGFIIFGYDQSKKDFKGATFPSSNLRDKAELMGLMVKNLSDVFVIDIIEDLFRGVHYSFIHIPPTKHKPIIVKKFQRIDKKGNHKDEDQRIFVRSATGTRVANKNDLDLMYYDNANIKSDFDLEIDLQSYWAIIDYKGWKNIYLISILENVGLRPLVLNSYSLSFSEEGGSRRRYNHSRISINDGEWETGPFKWIIVPGELLRIGVMFQLYSNKVEEEEEVKAWFIDQGCTKIFKVMTNKNLEFVGELSF